MSGTRAPLTLKRVVKRLNVESTRMSTPADFEARELRTFDELAAIDGWSEYLAYCIDFERQALLFAAGGSRTDSLEAPFFYLWQRRHAEHLIEVPFSRLIDMPSRGKMAPVFILSPGRVGSTLLLRLLRAGGLHTVSEPDPFTNFAAHKLLDSHSPLTAEQLNALRVCTEAFRESLGDTPVIKVRGDCCVLVDEILQALPDSRFVFLFRSRLPWAQSQARAFGFDAEEMGSVLRTSVLAFDQLRERGLQPRAIWYEQIVEHPIETVRSLGGEVRSPQDEERIQQILSTDAQHGTPLARSKLRGPGLSATELALFEYEWQRVRPTRQLMRCGLDRLL